MMRLQATEFDSATALVVVSQQMPEVDIKAYAKQFHGGREFREVSQGPQLRRRVRVGTGSRTNVTREGYVYYASDGNGRIKIGFSANPWSRVKENFTWCPGMKLLGTERGTVRLEQQRHVEFEEDHLALEWFKTSDRLMKLIHSLPVNAGMRHVVHPKRAQSFRDYNQRPEQCPHCGGLLNVNGSAASETLGSGQRRASASGLEPRNRPNPG